MRAGIGERADARGAADVFDYVLADPKTAIRSQKDSNGSADYCESIGRMGLIVGAAAQAAAALAPPAGERVVEEEAAAAAAGEGAYCRVLRAAVDAFTSESLTNGELVPKVAAALDAALGSCGDEGEAA